MNKKLSLSLAACACMVVLIACSDNTISTERSPVDTKAKLHVIVKDNTDGSQLPAKVTMQSTGESKTVPVPDAAIFAEVNAGSHSLLTEMEGYASKITNASIEGGSSGNVYIAGENYAVVQLPKANSSLEGYLFHTNKEGKSVPMAGAIVRIEFKDTELVEKSVDAVVDANGKYSFTGLPAVGSNYVIRLIGATVDSEYGTYTVSAQSPLEKDAASNNQKIDYNTDIGNNSDFAIISAVSGITILNENADKPFVFKFSQEIDLNRIKNSSVTVVNAVANISFAKDSLIIAPVEKWGGGDFYVCFNTSEVVSVLGKHLSLSGAEWISSCSSYGYKIRVLEKNIGAVKVSGFINIDSASIDYNSTKANFRWDRVEGATGYQVFAKEYGKDDYGQITGCSIAQSFDIVASCNLNQDGSKIAYKTTGFVVRAVNGDYTSLFSDEINVYERNPLSPDYDMALHVKPNSDSVVYFRNQSKSLSPKEFDQEFRLGNYFANAVAQQITNEGRVYFDRAMDMEAKLEISCKADSEKNPCNKLELTHEWDNEQRLNITVKTKANNTLAADDSINAIYSISGLKAKGTGKQFETLYNGSKRNTVNIRFTADRCSIDPFGVDCYCSTVASNYITDPLCCPAYPEHGTCTSLNDCNFYGSQSDECFNYCKTGDNYYQTICRDAYNACEVFGRHNECYSYCWNNAQYNYFNDPICSQIYSPCEIVGSTSSECFAYCESNSDDNSCIYKIIFSDGFEDGGKKWNISRISGVDRWFIGEAVTPPGIGTYTAYISADEGISSSYNGTEVNVSILYTTIEFPSEMLGFSLNYEYKGKTADVYLCPYDIVFESDFQTNCGNRFNDPNSNSNGWRSQTTAPSNFSNYMGKSYKLVFYWQNNYGGGIDGFTNGAAIIDNVRVYYRYR